MASRKEQKEQARAARLAQEQALAAKSQRTRRMQLFGGAIALAVVIVAVVVVVAVSGGKSPSANPNPTAYKTIHSLIGGIPQSGTTLGNPNAKVTLTYYGDLECPICQEFTLDVLPSFIPAEVRTGTVKIHYRSLCTATCNNTSEGNPQTLFDTQQVAAYAAGMQNKFWDYAELFYHEQGSEDTAYVTETYLQGLAKQIPGLSLTKWQTDRKDPTLLSQVTNDQSAAAKLGFASTPTLVMSGAKGSEQVGTEVEPGEYDPPDESQLVAAVKQVS